MKDFELLKTRIREHHAKGGSRIGLKVPGFSKQEVIEHWNEQTRGLEKPAVKVGAKGGPDPNEDGLARLRRRKKLTSDQLVQAMRIRRLGLTAELAVGSVKSCLDIGVGGGQGGGLPRSDGELVEALAAKRELFRLRWTVIRGEVDMLTVLDGVCIAGHTLIALAGNDPTRARELEIALKLALNQLHLEQFPPAQAAA